MEVGANWSKKQVTPGDLPHLVHLGIGHPSTLMGAGWVSQVEGGGPMTKIPE